MISPRQIKAARALLGWTQEDLAKAARLHANAVCKIENETASPRAATLARVQRCLEAAGIRFKGEHGLERKIETFETLRLEGKDRFKRMNDDMFPIVRGPNEEILNFVTDETLYHESGEDQVRAYFAHLRKTGARERYIMGKKNPALLRHKDRSCYRWLPEKALGTIAYTIYADRVAFVHWSIKEILIVRNASLADSFRGQFEFLWSQAKSFKA